MDRTPKSGEESERFDDILTRLRSIVDRLEGGNLSLEDSLHSFEQGMELCRRGAFILDAAEKRVEVLLAGPPGANRTAPLEPVDSARGPDAAARRAEQADQADQASRGEQAD